MLQIFSKPLKVRMRMHNKPIPVRTTLHNSVNLISCLFKGKSAGCIAPISPADLNHNLLHYNPFQSAVTFDFDFILWCEKGRENIRGVFTDSQWS